MATAFKAITDRQRLAAGIPDPYKVLTKVEEADDPLNGLFSAIQMSRMVAEVLAKMAQSNGKLCERRD